MFHSLQEEWPPRGFKLADFLKFLKLGLTEMTSASGRCPCVRAVYPSLPYSKLTDGPLSPDTTLHIPPQHVTTTPDLLDSLANFPVLLILRFLDVRCEVWGNVPLTFPAQGGRGTTQEGLAGES